MIPNGKVTPELEGYIGKEVIVGIRPEDIHEDEAFISPDLRLYVMHTLKLLK